MGKFCTYMRNPTTKAKAFGKNMLFLKFIEFYLRENLSMVQELERAPKRAPMGTQPLSIPSVTPYSRVMPYSSLRVFVGIWIKYKRKYPNKNWDIEMVHAIKVVRTTDFTL
jgi:hypothetical protein